MRDKVRESGEEYGAALGEMLADLKSSVPTGQVTREIGYLRRRARLLSWEMELIG